MIYLLVIGLIIEKKQSNIVNIPKRKVNNSSLNLITTWLPNHTPGIPDNKIISENLRFTLELPITNEHLTPFKMTIPLQLLAYHVASLKNCDIDKPRNLAKSVTVE